MRWCRWVNQRGVSALTSEPDEEGQPEVQRRDKADFFTRIQSVPCCEMLLSFCIGSKPEFRIEESKYVVNLCKSHQN